MDICEYCDGTGKRDVLFGAKCIYCDGTGLIEDPDHDEEFDQEEHDRELDEYSEPFVDPFGIL